MHQPWRASVTRVHFKNCTIKERRIASYTLIKKSENTLDLYPSQQQFTKTKSPFVNNKINCTFAPAFNR